MIARLTVRYLLIFAVVLVALSAGAYAFFGRQYAEMLAPALGTPEASAAYAVAMRRVAVTIATFDLPLLVAVGIAAWVLARTSIGPLLAAQDRERTFAADAAHALRSPLATIASIAQAQRAQAPGELRDDLDVIARSALDASAVVSDLLTLARSADARALLREPLDLVAVARDTIREFDQRALDRGLQLHVDGSSVIVNGDERRIRELLRNLLSNAVRHASSAVDVAVRDADGEAELSVANDGALLDDATSERVFERFYRQSGSPDGVGLGLAIVAWIAKAHDGSVVVRSDATARKVAFVVRLPALEAT